MLLRLSVIGLIAAVGLFRLAGEAEANSCQLLKQQMSMYQAAREMAQYHRVRLLFARSCMGSQRTIVATPARAPTQSRPSTRREMPRRSVAGTYRTWCVRSCDGYYFPVSFSTTREHLSTDQAKCERACPEAGPQLYYHRARGETPQDMVSLDGNPYSALPTAFNYREALNPSCSCGRPEGLGELLVQEARVDREQSATADLAPLPRPRREPGEDPETLANRDGHFDPRQITTVVIGQSRRVADTGVRVVWSDKPIPVEMSPVPNDFNTSLLWTAERAKARRAVIPRQVQ